ncbi:putative membrane protein [Xenococcus sp. PCC 7305]|uniref:YihY/virulence factor BrkB family protein n=1 Tax=Xenococcus sp. PCC 7305 TaxID=102125 RepID=UPI0002ABB04F|nr:YihY/virulence factor BrkB family protein [Xenococcus sp. PCC 7305]ELS02971.1 putative membrane protein [Xenococcus sp. PCC 7305]
MVDLICYYGYFIWYLIRRTVACTIQKRLTGLSSEMAFNAMLGLFPAIITILTAISLLENSVKATLGELANNFAGIVPEEVWNLLLNFKEYANISQGKSLFSISFVASIWVISGVICSAINALENIHQIPREKRRNFWHNRAIAIFLTIGTMILWIAANFLLLIGDFLLRLAVEQNWGNLLFITWEIFSVITIATILLAALYFIYRLQRTSAREPIKNQNTLIGLVIIGGTFLIQLVYSLFVFVQTSIVNLNIEQKVSFWLVSIWRWLSFPIALGIVAIAFAFIYQFGTSIRAKQIPLIPGAVLAAISWAIVSVVFRYYVFHAGIYNKIYGALGAVIILMLWLYLSSLVMLLGEQVNVIIGEAINNKKYEEHKIRQLRL